MNNAKYIGLFCIKCNKILHEAERQKIISLGYYQTWCISCAISHHPTDNLLQLFAKTDGKINFKNQ